MVLKNRVSKLEELIKMNSRYKNSNFTIHIATKGDESVITKTINGVEVEASRDEWALYCKKELSRGNIDYKVILPEVLGGEIIEL